MVLTNPIVLSTSGQHRHHAAGQWRTPTILLDAVGENRLPTFQNLDLHAGRPVS